MKDTLFYKIVRPIIVFLFYLLFQPKIVGRKNIPVSGGVVLAGNHTRWLDPLLIIASSKREVHFLAKIELFHSPLKPIMMMMSSISVDRKKPSHNIYDMSEGTLKSGRVIGIFPEGTINRTKETIIPFKKGAVRMARDTDSTIVPFVITGKYIPIFNNLKIEYLPPLDRGKNIEIDNIKLMNTIKTKLEEEHEKK